MQQATFLALFLFGLFGGLHCAGMCGGLVTVLSMSQAGESGRRVWQQRLGYNVGRIASYVLAGSLAGALGSASSLAASVLPVQQVLFTLANVTLIAMGAYLLGWSRPIHSLEPLGVWLWRRVQPLAARRVGQRGAWAAVVTGALWGWVPCAMVYSALVAALVSGSAARGAALLLAFGLGTLPNLLLLGWGVGRGLRWLGQGWPRRGVGVLIACFGGAGLLRLDPTAHLHDLVQACVTWWPR